MFQDVKWTETLILGGCAAILPVIAGLIKEFFSVFNARLAGRTEERKIEIEKEKEFQNGVLDVLKFLEERNEYLSKECDRLRSDKDQILMDLIKVREDKVRLEVRSEFRMAKVREGHTDYSSYEKVSEIEAFHLDDQDAIVISDDDKRVFAASKAALLLLGYDDVTEIKHRSIDEIFPGFHAAAFSAGVLGAGTTIFRGELKAGIVGKPMQVEAITKSERRFPIRGVLRTWTDGSRIYYAFVIETKTNLITEAKPPALSGPEMPTTF